MAKIRVCDICRKDGKLTESKRYNSLKGHPDLRIDVCDAHKDTAPNNAIEYIIFAMKVLYGMDVDHEQAEERLRTRG